MDIILERRTSYSPGGVLEATRAFIVRGFEEGFSVTTGHNELEVFQRWKWPELEVKRVKVGVREVEKHVEVGPIRR